MNTNQSSKVPDGSLDPAVIGGLMRRLKRNDRNRPFIPTGDEPSTQNESSGRIKRIILVGAVLALYICLYGFDILQS